MRLHKGQRVLWWSDQTGWRAFRVTDVRDGGDRVEIMNRQGHMKTVSLDRYAHRIRTHGLKILMPWLFPYNPYDLVLPTALRWNAPRRRRTSNG